MPEASFHIDQNWYQESGRSLPSLARSRLCESCQEGVASGSSFDELSALIRDCCSGQEDFLAFRLPVKERCFRLFLANSNQPLTLEQMSERLGKQEEQGITAIPAEVLKSLIETDSFYGIRPVAGSVSDLEQGKTSAKA